VRRNQRFLDGEARDRLAVQTGAAYLAPSREDAASLVDVVLLERKVNVGEKMAALAKPHREIERRDVEQEREERAGPVRGRIHEPGAEHHGQHRKQPGYGPLPRFAGIE